MKQKLKDISTHIEIILLKNKVIVDRENSVKNIKINKNKINSTKDDKLRFHDIVTYFLKTLTEQCREFDNSLFVKNFKDTSFDLNVPKNETRYLNYKRENTFNGCVQVRDINENYRLSFYYLTEKSAFHELMHLSSSKNTENAYLSGFNYYNKTKKAEFCRGINEGYTQYLTKRYFKGKCNNSYIIETHAIEPLEIIVGKSKMQKYYFNADLVSLLSNLGKYASEKEIIEYIENFDEITKINLDQNEKGSVKESKIRILIQKIYSFYLTALKNEILTFDKYNLKGEEMTKIMYLWDKSNWFEPIVEKYFKVSEEDYNKAVEETRNYLSIEEAKKIS